VGTELGQEPHHVLSLDYKIGEPKVDIKIILIHPQEIVEILKTLTLAPGTGSRQKPQPPLSPTQLFLCEKRTKSKECDA